MYNSFEERKRDRKMTVLIDVHDICQYAVNEEKIASFFRQIDARKGGRP